MSDDSGCVLFFIMLILLAWAFRSCAYMDHQVRSSLAPTAETAQEVRDE